MTDEQYISATIRDECAGQDALSILDDFSFSIDRIDSVTKRCTVRFCNELPLVYDIPWHSEFQAEWGFHDWLTTTVRNYIFDAKALPYEDAGFDYQASHETDIRDHSEDAVDALCYGVNYICNGRANGKTACLGIPFSGVGLLDTNWNSLLRKITNAKPINSTSFNQILFKKGSETMANTTERYMTESEARYDAEVKRIDAELEQAVADAQYQAQSKRCEVEKLFREERIKEQETEKAFRQKAYYDGLISAGFNKDEAMKILLEEI